MVELDSLNTKYKDCMKDVERLKMDLRFAVNFSMPLFPSWILKSIRNHCFLIFSSSPNVEILNNKKLKIR
jgi:hypothetical protein